MIGGPYALLAVGAVVVGLGGFAAIQYHRADAASLRAGAAQETANRLADELRASEAGRQDLMAAAKKLNAAIVARDKRARELENAKRKLAKELDELKNSLPAEDQACLDRPLPPAILERLRVPTDHDNQGGEGARTGEPDRTVSR